MGLFGVLGIVRDGLNAQSGALTLTSQNVANVNTPGYVKRSAHFETAEQGGSVRFTSAARHFDRFVFGHTVMEQSKKAAAEARAGALGEMEAAIAPDTGSIGDLATLFARAWNALAAAPTEPSQRQDVLGKAQNLVNGVQATATSLESQSETLLGRAHAEVRALNDRLKAIGDLNQQIATADGSGLDASALRDQRDVAVRDVASRIGARALEDGSGRLTLFAAGVVLVEGNSSVTLSMDLDGNGAMRFFSTGATRTEITSRIDTGSLGGVREARDGDLAKLKADLDAYAFDVANAYNLVHQTGFGADGQTGRPLFEIPSGMAGAAKRMAVDLTMVDHPERLATSQSAADLPGGNTVARAMADLADKPVFGGAPLVDRFAEMATETGFRKASADAELELRTDTFTAAETLFDSAHGVSVDEEMVDLTRYQRAFEASSKLLRTVDELLRSLMEAV